MHGPSSPSYSLLMLSHFLTHWSVAVGEIGIPTWWCYEPYHFARDSAPDDVATLENNHKNSFVGNLINRIPDTRVKMQIAITAVLTAMLSDIKQNLEYFLLSIQQRAQGLHGPKTLTEGSQISLRAHFQDYMTSLSTSWTIWSSPISNKSANVG